MNKEQHPQILMMYPLRSIMTIRGLPVCDTV